MPFRLRCIALLLLLSSCHAGPTAYQETRFMMGTVVTFTILGADKAAAAAAVKDAADTMQRLADRLTIYGARADSVKAFNASIPGTPVHLSADAETVLQAAMRVYRQSGGAFDPALGALDVLWGFSIQPAPTTPPSEASIRRDMTTARCLTRQHDAWERDSTVCQLDFGGIGKGYIVDRGLAVLKRHGIANAIVNAGGNLRVIGRHGKRLWHIGIKHPRHQADMLGSVDLKSGESISTSGDYQHFFMYKGKRYHHILDPATGRPARGVESATIIAPSGILSDAWSTALFVMGPKGLPLVARLGMDGMIVDSDGKLHMTPGMAKRFQPLDTTQ